MVQLHRAAGNRNSASRYLSERNKNICPHTDLYANAYCNFLIVPNCKQLKCQSIRKCFSNLWYIQAMDKWEGANSWCKQCGWIPKVMLREGSMTRKCQYHMIPFTWNSLASSSQSTPMNADQRLPKHKNGKGGPPKKIGKFGGNRNVLYLDSGVGIYICPHSSNCTLKMCALFVYKLYFN